MKGCAFRYRTQRDPDGTFKEELIAHLFEQNYQQPLLPPPSPVRGFISNFISVFCWSFGIMMLTTLVGALLFAVLH